jgi:hypothetical protein
MPAQGSKDLLELMLEEKTTRYLRQTGALNMRGLIGEHSLQH